MNEQIRVLAERAGGLEVKTVLNTPPAISLNGHEIEKLAQLIVQECIDTIETYRIPVGNSAAGEMAYEWTYDALKEIRDKIKEHFGVE